MTTLREENRTAIGDALGLAVERLCESPARSRVAVLLTDGVNNAGVESPRAAAELARTQGVRVYAIGAGTTGMAHMRVEGARGSVLRAVRVEIDEATLRDVAERTGGRYFRAGDAQALVDVYAEIDRLERAPIVEDRSRQVRMAPRGRPRAGRGRLAGARRAVREGPLEWPPRVGG